MIEQAQAFCVAAHAGQKRKFDGSPYWTHPFAVANILASFGIEDEEMLSAAYLHDVLEDTQATVKDLFMFTERTIDLVLGLTDISTPSDGNRAARKAIDRAHTLDQSDDVHFIKCADIYHNATTFPDGQGEYWKLEKRLLLDGMRIKDTQLWKKAWSLVT